MLNLPANEAAELATLSEIFVGNATALVDEPLRGAFGVCCVLPATPPRRVSNIFANIIQLPFAARSCSRRRRRSCARPPQRAMQIYLSASRPTSRSAHGLTSTSRCRCATALDAGPFVGLCGEYTRLFKRPCKLLFGYMAKAIAIARSPYSSTFWLDTDTFICDAAPLLAVGQRLMSQYDLLIGMPRTTQGWVNSGVLGVRRECSKLGDPVAARVSIPR